LPGIIQAAGFAETEFRTGLLAVLRRGSAKKKQLPLGVIAAGMQVRQSFMR
jgi:hypothetical protein